MTIWLLVLVLLGIFASAGAQQGAIRMAVALIGVFFGAFFALKLDGLVAPLVPMVGLANPVWKWVVPPVVIFLAFAVGFGMLAQFVHRKAHLYYTYKAEDEDRLRWERLNDKLGTCIGLAMGGTYSLLLGLVIYVVGYLTIQLKSPGENPAAVDFINRARTDLSSTGLDKLIAAIDPTPDAVYDAADLFGLIYNNPDLASRASQYPPFLALGEKQEFQDIAMDAAYGEMIRNQANLFAILNHPRTQAVLKSQELIDVFKQTDVKDVLQFVKTGKSAKFDGEKILGRWELDVTATVQAFAKKNPDAPATELNRLKSVVSARMSDLTVVADTLNEFVLKGSQSDVSQFGAILSDKKGVLPPALSAGKDAPLRVLAQGKWSKDGDKYQVTLKMETSEKSAQARIDDQDRLEVSIGTETLVFSHAQ